MTAQHNTKRTESGLHSQQTTFRRKRMRRRNNRCCFALGRLCRRRARQQGDLPTVAHSSYYYYANAVPRLGERWVRGQTLEYEGADRDDGCPVQIADQICQFISPVHLGGTGFQNRNVIRAQGSTGTEQTLAREDTHT